MADIQTEILERLVRLETKIDDYNRLRDKVDTTYNMSSQNTRDVTEIKSNQKWLWRTFAGALILGFIATYIKWI
jgi:hypothetical protein